MTPCTIQRVMSPKLGGVIEHDAILVSSYGRSVLYELHPDGGLQARELSPDDEFTLISILPAHAIPAALQRLQRALDAGPSYHVLFRNCQQFAEYVERGRWSSRTLRGLAKAAATGVLLGVAANVLGPRLGRTR